METTVDQALVTRSSKFERRTKQLSVVNFSRGTPPAPKKGVRKGTWLGDLGFLSQRVAFGICQLPSDPLLKVTNF